MDAIYLLIIALLVVCLWLTKRRLSCLKAYLSDLSSALEQERPPLQSETDPFLEGIGVQTVNENIAALLQERKDAATQETGTLQTIDATLANLTEAVILLSDKNELLLANPAARTLLSLGENASGNRVETMLSSSTFLSIIAKAKAGEFVGREEVIVQSAGEEYILEVASARVGEAHPSYLFVLHDITRLKKLEGVRREFVANVSHELRTPVTIIRGFTDTLIEDLDELPKDSQRRFLLKIQKNVSRLTVLLEDLLTLSRLEYPNRQKLAQQHYNLNGLISEITENFTERMGKDRTFEIEIDPAIQNVAIDPIKISQVFENLFDNSLRYGNGFTRITITAQLQGGQALICVADNGPGVPEAHLDKLFQRFYRVDKGRSQNTGGTGLGMSIIKHILQLHGSEVYAENAEGGGLAIHFSLPIASALNDD